MTDKKLKKKLVLDCLKKINPKLINIVETKKYDFINENYLDSFDVMNLIIELEKKSKTKINTNKISEKNFKNVETIIKLLD